MEYLAGLLIGFLLGACTMGAIMEWHQKEKDKDAPPADEQPKKRRRP